MKRNYDNLVPTVLFLLRERPVNKVDALFVEYAIFDTLKFYLGSEAWDFLLFNSP